MSCETIKNELPMMLYGELTFDHEEIVQQHLDVCRGCRDQLEHLRRLHYAIDRAEPELPPQLLAECRRSLRSELASASQADPYRQTSPLGFLARLWPAAGMIWKPAGAVALLAIGFLWGRSTPASETLTLAQEPEPMVSRVRYVQPDGSDRVQIVIEEVRQRVLRGDLSDNDIRGMLVSAARDAHDPGVRVETMDLLKTHSESLEVRRALLAALQHDPNPGVRLKAIEALQESPTQDAEMRRVLASVLLQDDNPGVRTHAIDLLTQEREPAMVGVFQELMTRENNNYVRLKCQRALNDMNASVETF